MLALEIGFGNGGFLIDQATTHPNQNFVGIDTSWPSVERLLHKLNRTQLGNIRVLHGDAATIAIYRPTQFPLIEIGKGFWIFNF